MPELVGAEISESLLDIAIGLLSDDSVVNERVRKIPCTKIKNLREHFIAAFEALEPGEDIYTPFYQSSLKEVHSINWILFDMIYRKGSKPVLQNNT